MSTVPATSISVSRAVLALRVTVAVLLGIHGFYRAFAGGVAGFGSYLTISGIPFGLSLAWLITVFEMAGSLLLLLGRFVSAVVPGFLLILVSGVVMVHAREGWFVVGGGRNGAEYSVLLIVSLLIVLLSHRAATSQR
jgi:putative oxidoreductase